MGCCRVRYGLGVSNRHEVLGIPPPLFLGGHQHHPRQQIATVAAVCNDLDKADLETKEPS